MQGAHDDGLRDEAIERLKKKHDFYPHVIAYVLVNLFLVGIWAVTGAGFFWPVFPILGWGIGLVLHGLKVYHYGGGPSESQIEREMARLRR